MPTFNLTINNTSHTVEADIDTPLLWILRDNEDSAAQLLSYPIRASQCSLKRKYGLV
jgi:aerobic-type carbon monoxide dehydrogenase small subunit (CoxS/CutS family)